MRTQRSKSRGFSLLETVASTLVLGVGTLALTRAFSVTHQGMSWTRSHTTASTLLAQRMADLSTRSADQIPKCTGARGCRATRSEIAAELSPSNGFPCTQHSAGEAPLTEEPGASTDRFRIDVVLEAPPDPGRYPTAQLATVSVCWIGENSIVEEVQATRMLLAED